MPERNTTVPWWTGLPFLLGIAAVWLTLAVTSPSTTYHFAPMIMAAAVPVARRSRTGGRLAWRELAVAAAAGVVASLSVTILLVSLDALSGPTFFGTPGAVRETLVMTGLGALIGLLIGSWRTSRSSTTAR
ncbi:MAG: hypothetical protein ACRDSE_20065 [Pseudonocardiaceae bacterium]